MGLFAIRKLGAANYKKLLPVVILIAAERAGGGGLSRMQLTGDVPCVSEEVTSSVVLKPTVASLVREDVETLTRTERKKQILDVPTRKYSRLEKTTFDLRPENQGLRKVMLTLCLESHFVDLSPEDQKTIRELVYEQNKNDEKAEQLRVDAEKNAIKENRRRARAENREAKLAKKQAFKSEAQTKRLRRDYSGLLRNLEFDEAALQRLLHLDESQLAPVRDKLGLLNLGNVVYRDAIADTQPKTYEAKAGYDYRIYYHPDGPKLRVRLIGDKGTQESDLKLLRA